MCFNQTLIIYVFFNMQIFSQIIKYILNSLRRNILNYLFSVFILLQDMVVKYENVTKLYISNLETTRFYNFLYSRYILRRDKSCYKNVLPVCNHTVYECKPVRSSGSKICHILTYMYDRQGDY